MKKIIIALKKTVRATQFFKEINQDGYRQLKALPMWRNFFGHESTHLESDIIRLYHVIEKGLCMPEFRPRFGSSMVRQLQDSLKRWDGEQTTQIESGWRVLEAYVARHSEMGIDISDILELPLGIPSSCLNQSEGGIRDFSRIDEADRAAFLRVFSSRSSMRHFDPTKIPSKEAIKEAVKVSLRTPSVCNRQTWRVHSYASEDAQKLLALQNVNRGFGQTIPHVLVVTSDLRLFTGTSERYQSWIDGGMFSMSLLLALHSGGLGAISLNWSVLNRQDKALRAAADIPDHERIIMLIGCGYPVENSKVPVSSRRSPEDILTCH